MLTQCTMRTKTMFGKASLLVIDIYVKSELCTTETSTTVNMRLSHGST